ncbi:MAG: MBL fold metallo-hydrolase [Caldilineaceae bacterium]|nr:MBL fold metallo-hydrolase [Caldilineaceae bacterium]
MDINWYGLSCLRIREGGVTILCDPYDKSIGITMPKVRADIVTISHEQAGHNAIDRATGEPKVIAGPGEYETNNVFITGATTYHRKQSPSANERNVIFFFDFGGLIVGHLVDLGEVLSQSAVDDMKLGEIDILFVPVGGGSTLDATHAVEVVSVFEPKIVIPMHYQHPGLTTSLAEQLEPVDKFLKEFGAGIPEPQETLKISKSNLPEETEVVLLSLSQ